MKSTIKITTTRAIVIQPCKTGGILLTLEDRNGQVRSAEAINLTPDQAGALVFALEAALETIPGSPELLNDRG